MPEAILEPELPIVDPHHHLWDRSMAPPPPPGPEHPFATAIKPAQRYLLDGLLADTGSGHNVVATVFLECSAFYRADGPVELRAVGETEFVNGVAAMSASGIYGPTRACAGIVGRAELTLGDAVKPVLEAHVRAGGGRFRGVRHSGNWDADPIIGNGALEPDVYRRPDFRAGLARLSAFGLSLDAWVFHTQLADVIELARAFPGTNIIMGHVGGVLGYGPYAGKRDEIFTAWKAAIAELAKCPNVTMKLGGMMMRAAFYDYRMAERPVTSEELAAQWGPYVEYCIEKFGPQRCMFESNFPVEKMGIGWVPLWNAFKRIAAGASADEKRALFHDTAQRVYRLG